MHKIGPNAILAIILILTGFPVMLAAQESGDDPAVEPDWDVYSTDLYVAGDQTFIISLGTVFPALFYNNKGDSQNMQFTPPVGGTGTLIYNYYLHSKFFLGGEISGLFINTIVGKTLFIVPLGVRAGTQFLLGRFEFPVTLSLGMTWHTYINKAYYGFFAKAGAAAYFRATSEWSFGITAEWSWYPEWTDKASHNVDGHFVNTMISARYHF